MKLKKSNDHHRAERFEAAFNRIHMKLKDLCQNHSSDSFMDLLNVANRKHAIIRKHYNDLKQFARLRNAIVHEKIHVQYFIAEPHSDIVNRIEEISDELNMPVRAIDISTSPVVYFHPDTTIVEVLHTIDRESYNQYPVYDKCGKYIGLLTVDGIAKCMSHKIVHNTIYLTGILVQNILEIEKQRNVEFIDQHTLFYDVEELFEKYKRKNQKLEAVIITNNGAPNQKPLGIITPWDLIKR